MKTNNLLNIKTKTNKPLDSALVIVTLMLLIGDQCLDSLAIEVVKEALEVAVTEEETGEMLLTSSLIWHPNMFKRILQRKMKKKERIVKEEEKDNGVKRELFSQKLLKKF
jgi:hypothetical protein